MGRKEEGLCVFLDWTAGPSDLAASAEYGLGIAKGCGCLNVTVSVPLGFRGVSLATVLGGSLDADFTAAFKAIHAAYPGALVRLGEEHNLGGYPWTAAGGQDKAFAAAWDYVAALARACGIEPWLCPALGQACNLGEPSTVKQFGYDGYRTPFLSAGATAEPKMLANEEADYWGFNTLTTWKPKGTLQGMFEVGFNGDDGVFAAGILKLCADAGLQFLGVWDADDDYAGGLISDGSQPAVALELWKALSPFKSHLVGASIAPEDGPFTATLAGEGMHSVLATLEDGSLGLVFWGDTLAVQTVAITLSAPKVVTLLHPDGSTKPCGSLSSMRYAYSGGLCFAKLYG